MSVIGDYSCSTPLSTPLLGKCTAGPMGTRADLENLNFSDSAEIWSAKGRDRSGCRRQAHRGRHQNECSRSGQRRAGSAQKLVTSVPRSSTRITTRSSETITLATFATLLAHWVTMRAVYDALRFSEHRGSKECRKNRPHLKVPGDAWLRLQEEGRTANYLMHGPFRLAAESDRRIANYSSRTPELYGGTPSRLGLAKERFRNVTAWPAPTKKQKKMVKVSERNRTCTQWRSVHSLDAVFSTLCEETVYAADVDSARPCEACNGPLQAPSLRFSQNAIGRPFPGAN
ncbi:hypothetical protein NMY22_g9056 [Coprinellus aureogranulatus]|nr:hypothetical protein NMY22_g9056 [Coprinellus aureogranulatus]